MSITEDVYTSGNFGEDDMYNSRTSLSMLDRNTNNVPGGHNNKKGNILARGDPSMLGNGEFNDDGRPTCCFGMFNNAGRHANSEIDPSKRMSLNTLQTSFLEIFEENLPKYASSMELVREFLKLATKTLESQDR